ncbi:terminase large subunit [Mycobacterium phage Fowlmouth]|uniref:Terminase large subunit n=2 Tax=Fowlmouthvirus fowlmouth TaxID=2845652 RepID=A0A7G8LPP4_9CAUD|nr:terminase large subunit [Mycobacterium phage Fowlmouth]AYN57951.1 terminase large subunit [Mycobacterium phage Fowlmouth]QNJ59216.1 terminase large subunit [Mycobacterium phage MrMiyagi]
MTALLNKWAIYNHPLVNWKPHQGQLIVAQSASRHQVLSAGRRFGKSFIGGYRLLPEIFFTKPIANQLLLDGKKRIFWIVGPNYSDSEKEFRVIWNLCRRLEIPMDQPGSYNSPETGQMQIKLFGGAMEIVAKSAQNPERLVGEGLSGVILSEAAKLKENIWYKYIRPTLADFGGWSFHSSTPEGKNWFYRVWQQGQDPNNVDWSSWRMPAWMNNFVYRTPTNEQDVLKLIELQKNTGRSVFKLAKEYNLTIDPEILSSINELTPEAFLQEIAADFTEFVGRVFKEFDEEKHVTDLEYQPGWQTFAAVDYGYHNPNVWLLLQVSKWGEINVLDEIYEEGLDPEDFADEIRWRRLNPPNLKYFFPDPADPGASRILEKKLGIQAMGGTGGELSNRINHIRKALRDPRYTTDDDLIFEAGQMRPRLLFDRKCKRTIEDMLSYRYPEKKIELETSAKRFENPLKKYDHGPEALGRFFAGFYGQFGKPMTGATIHKASFSSRTDEIERDPSDFSSSKDEGFMRPGVHERRRYDFPVVNDALGNYLNGAYD